MIEKRLEESIILHLIALGDALKRRRDQISQGLGITTQQWLIMLYLAKDPNLPFFESEQHDKKILAAEITRALNVSRPNVTNLIATLLDKGLAVQIEDTEDRRRKRLALSPEGVKLLESLQPMRKMLNEQLFEDLSTDERQVFLALIETCLRRLSA
ncbi:MAG: winged helix DNA-binding protein [Rhodothermia bacterium]|nr:winged helix DNA-binding protein [Rhodothermia bacterium]